MLCAAEFGHVMRPRTAPVILETQICNYTRPDEEANRQKQPLRAGQAEPMSPGPERDNKADSCNGARQNESDIEAFTHCSHEYGVSANEVVLSRIQESRNREVEAGNSQKSAIALIPTRSAPVTILRPADIRTSSFASLIGIEETSIFRTFISFFELQSYWIRVQIAVSPECRYCYSSVNLTAR